MGAPAHWAALFAAVLFGAIVLRGAGAAAQDQSETITALTITPANVVACIDQNPSVRKLQTF